MSRSRKGARISVSSPPAAPTNGSSDTMSGAHLTKAITTTDGRVLIEQPDGTYRPAASQTDWARLDAMTEGEEERLAAEDMAELGMDPDWMGQATVRFPRPTDRATARLGPAVLDLVKAPGRWY